MSSTQHRARPVSVGPTAGSPSISAWQLAREQKQVDGDLAPPPAWWEQTLPGVLQQWGAFGAYLGFKTVAGRRTRQLCLVVQTLSKHDPRRSSGIKRIPARIRWRDGRIAYSLPTDVLERTNVFERQVGAIFGPGDLAAFSGNVATIGAAVSHRLRGRCLLTAGHLLPPSVPAGTAVQTRANGIALNTRLVGHARKGSVDYALLAPVRAAPLDNLVEDALRIGPVYTPTRRDVGRRVRVVRQDGRFHATVCRGVSHHFVDSTGEFFANTILTGPITVPGDSGGALVDEDNLLWGFLVGQSPGVHSAFAPASMVLHAAGVSLA